MIWKDFAKLCNICVVACAHRPPVTMHMLAGEDVIINYTFDYIFNNDEYVKAENEKYLCNKLGALRCYKGHQDVLKLVDRNKPYCLVFEDDAGIKKDWRTCVLNAVNILEKTDIVSLHGRDFSKNYPSIKINDDTFFIMAKSAEVKSVLGSLSYLIKTENIDKIISRKFDGLPMDLYIVNEFNFAVIDDSPFIHDRTVDSVLAKAK
jgi:hypothetical protein